MPFYVEGVQKVFFNHERHEKAWRGLIARNPHGRNTDGTRTEHGRNTDGTRTEHGRNTDGTVGSVGSVGSVRETNRSDHKFACHPFRQSNNPYTKIFVAVRVVRG